MVIANTKSISYYLLYMILEPKSSNEHQFPIPLLFYKYENMQF